MWTLELVAPAEAEPLDLETEVQQQLRLSSEEMSDQEALLAGLIATARMACEVATNRQLITATWELRMSSWWERGLLRDCLIRIPRPPLVEVVSVKYLDTAGEEQTLAPDQYVCEPTTGPYAQRAVLFPAYGVTWPTVRCQPGAIKVQFEAGYGDAFSDVPAQLRQGMLLRISELYEQRTESTVGTIQSPNQQVADALWWPFVAW